MKRFSCIILVLCLMFAMASESVFAICDYSIKYTNYKKGEYLKANVWRQSGDGTKSGNALKWEYQVSATYKGKVKVNKIRCSWNASASLRCRASINLGISGSGVSVGASSSWRTVRTKTKYWENSNGAKESSWRSNITVSPRRDYRGDTITTKSTGRLYLVGNKKPFVISAIV